jgi:hypothetical protein
VGPDSKRVKFKNETGEDESVYDYFRRQYGYAIQKPDLPCLHVGNPNATNYIPLERLRLKAQVTQIEAGTSFEITRIDEIV